MSKLINDKAFDNKRVIDLIEEMDIEEKLLCVHGQMWDIYRANQAAFVRGNDRLNIPDLIVADGESGVNISWETTAFPVKVSLASTFDKKSAYAYGRQLGREAKSGGVHVLLTPRVNIVRDPIAAKGTSNGGNYQTYGEDPILNGKLGTQEALGIQENKQAIANLKQMFGSSTGSAQGAGNSVIDEQTIHELYMKPFEMVLRSGVASAMTSYNQINGTWTYDYEELMSSARNEWGFKGFIFDDWFCLYDPNAIKHGVTMEMPGKDYYDEGSERSCYGKDLLNAINNPNEPVTMEDLDKAVYYYLDTLDRFGLLDEEQRIPSPISDDVKEESVKVAREIAGKGAVLLKNENELLPINFKDKKVGIVGVGGRHQVMATFKESSYGFEDRKNSVYNILKNSYDNVSFSDGMDMDGEIIPAEFLKPEKNSSENGLKRYVAPFIYETLSNGDIEEYVKNDNFIVDEVIDYKLNNALPVLKHEPLKADFKEAPRPYYMWSGFLCPKETGLYRVSMQSKFPHIEEFEKNEIQNGDLDISTSGNLYIRPSENAECLRRIGTGTRVFGNGVTNPFSEVIPCKDGYNNAGGYVYLEAGKEYEIYFNHTNICKEPVELRLNWTTPSMMKKAEEDAVKLAEQSDVVLYFAWHHSVNDSLKLEANQDDLIEKIATVNKNVVVILNNGDAVEMPWRHDVSAILEMWFSGQEGALATVDILTGACNPAGRLPISFPEKLEHLAARDIKHPERFAPCGRISKKDAIHPNTAHFTEGLLNGYRWFDKTGVKPMFAFGFGLSYTKFLYNDIVVTKNYDTYTVKVSITNIGEVDGDEVVQCYLGEPTELPEHIKCAPKVLADFERVFIKKGETIEVELEITNDVLMYYNVDKRIFERLTGSRDILIGASSDDIRLIRNIIV